MIYSFEEEALKAAFVLSTDFAADREMLATHPNLIALLWNRSNAPVSMEVDGIPLQLKLQQIISTTYFQHIEIDRNQPPLTAFAFNRAFYCIQDHDAEVSCNGIIFFGTQRPPIVSLDQEERRKFDLLFRVFEEEFRTRDNIQGEMLRMLLKRLIIKTTRLARKQVFPQAVEEGQVDLMRKFQVLVDLHFREKKQVQEYAELLFKSPKTLSNLFANSQQGSPLSIIHHRIVLEARRLLMFSDKSAKEIAFELGFEETASFFKLFKKLTGHTPLQFKESQQKEVREKSTP